MAIDKISLHGIADNAVGTAHIAADVIVADDIANNAITIAELNSTLDLSSKTVTLPTLSKAGVPLTANRTSSDGDIIELHKDGSEIGSLSVESGSLHIGGGDVGLGFYQVANSIVPINAGTRALSDGAIDLGMSSGRYHDLYLAGGIKMNNASDMTSVTTGSIYQDSSSRLRFAGGTGGYLFCDDTNGTGQLKIDDGGRVTMPAQPTFLARYNGSSVNISNEVWVFNATNVYSGFNIGSHYSTSTGKFTAPVAGTYYFHFSSIISTQGTNLTIQLRINNSAADQIHISQDESGWNVYGLSSQYYLNASDYVTVYVAGNYTLYGHNWSRFTGHLIG